MKFTEQLNHEGLAYVLGYLDAAAESDPGGPVSRELRKALDSALRHDCYARHDREVLVDGGALVHGDLG